MEWATTNFTNLALKIITKMAFLKNLLNQISFLKSKFNILQPLIPALTSKINIIKSFILEKFLNKVKNFN